MDLMGPLLTATGAGKGSRKEPTYLLVMVDPFSHRAWLPIYSKHAEQVCDAFVRWALLEGGGARGHSLLIMARSSTMSFFEI